MRDHFHSDLVFVLLAGVSAIVVINGIRFLSAPFVTRDDVAGKVARAAGALVTFGG